MNNEQIEKANAKIRDLKNKKATAKLQAVADYIEGVIEGVAWCLREL